MPKADMIPSATVEHGLLSIRVDIQGTAESKTGMGIIQTKICEQNTIINILQTRTKEKWNHTN